MPIHCRTGHRRLLAGLTAHKKTSLEMFTVRLIKNNDSDSFEIHNQTISSNLVVLLPKEKLPLSRRERGSDLTADLRFKQSPYRGLIFQQQAIPSGWLQPPATLEIA